MTQLLNGIAPLSHLGVIRVEGEDAAKFLHGQLTQDFALLDMQHARLAAFLSAKGRMQASFIGFKRSATEVLLVCSLDLLAPTLKRLSMFVLRAKAKLSDATADFALYGLAGDTIKTIAGGALPAWSKVDLDQNTIIHLYPAAGQPRALWIAPQGSPAPQGPQLDPSNWLWSEVQSGVATLTAPLVDAFVPQMLNYESVGGVNFKKGCYPGQEVVARSQFRGAIKRRAFVGQVNGDAAAGQEDFAARDPDQPVGRIAQAAPAPGDASAVIVSVQTADVAAGHALALGGAGGPVLEGLRLPSPFLDDT